MLQQMMPEVNAALFGLVFLEGLLAFVSPCILPMIPIYLLYLGGSEGDFSERRRLLRNTLGFIAGFSLIFVVLGATASAFGRLLSAHRVLLQRAAGAVVILFGLNYAGVFRVGFLNRTRAFQVPTKNLRFWPSALFGAAFSLGWTPCLGAFLGTALLLASNSATLYQGVGLLFTFSSGLAVPFFLASLLWHKLQGAFDFIKRNLPVIQTVSGILLILVGFVMLLGRFGSYTGLFAL